MTQPQILPATEHLIVVQRHPILIARQWRVTDLADNETVLDTTAYTADLTIRQSDWDGDIVLAADETDYITLGYTPAPWEDTTAYGLGHFVVPTALNGFIYICTTAGTSHASTEPTWPTTISGTVNDGTVTWTCYSTDSWVMNCYVNIPSSVTALLDDWGAGVWSLELTDSFGETQQMLQGSAWLQRSAT